MDYRYAYFLGALSFLLVWLIIWFLMDKKFKPFYLHISLIMLVLGPIGNYLWFLQDWWRPQTLFGTLWGIEDLILSFTNASIAAAIGLWFYGRQTGWNYDRRRFLLPILAIFILTAFFYYIIGFHSFTANTLAALLVTVFLLRKRPKALVASMKTALILFLAVIPIYVILEYVFPGWIEATWLWQDLSGLKIGIIPIEDLLWYAAVGFGFSGLAIHVNFGDRDKVPEITA